MSRKTIEHVDTYEAVDDTGSRHTVLVFQEVIEATFLDGRTQRTPGLKSHKMRNGNHVNVNADGTLFEVETGRTLRRA